MGSAYFCNQKNMSNGIGEITTAKTSPDQVSNMRPISVQSHVPVLPLNEVPNTVLDPTELKRVSGEHRNLAPLQAETEGQFRSWSCGEAFDGTVASPTPERFAGKVVSPTSDSDVLRLDCSDNELSPSSDDEHLDKESVEDKEIRKFREEALKSREERLRRREDELLKRSDDQKTSDEDELLSPSAEEDLLKSSSDEEVRSVNRNNGGKKSSLISKDNFRGKESVQDKVDGVVVANVDKDDCLSVGDEAPTTDGPKDEGLSSEGQEVVRLTEDGQYMVFSEHSDEEDETWDDAEPSEVDDVEIIFVKEKKQPAQSQIGSCVETVSQEAGFDLVEKEEADLVPSSDEIVLDSDEKIDFSDKANVTAAASSNSVVEAQALPVCNSDEQSNKSDNCLPVETAADNGLPQHDILHRTEDESFVSKSPEVEVVAIDHLSQADLPAPYHDAHPSPADLTAQTDAADPSRADLPLPSDAPQSSRADLPVPLVAVDRSNLPAQSVDECIEKVEILERSGLEEPLQRREGYVSAEANDVPTDNVKAVPFRPSLLPTTLQFSKIAPLIPHSANDWSPERPRTSSAGPHSPWQRRSSQQYSFTEGANLFQYDASFGGDCGLIESFGGGNHGWTNDNNSSSYTSWSHQNAGTDQYGRNNQCGWTIESAWGNVNNVWDYQHASAPRTNPDFGSSDWQHVAQLPIEPLMRLDAAPGNPCFFEDVSLDSGSNFIVKECRYYAAKDIFKEDEIEDNNDPRWESLRKLTTDAERYASLRKRWGNPTIPDPRKNLTTHNFLRKHRARNPQSTESIPILSNGRKRKASSSLSCERPGKRLCTILDEAFADVDRKTQQEIERLNFERLSHIGKVEREKEESISDLVKVYGASFIHDSYFQEIELNTSRKKNDISMHYDSLIDRVWKRTSKQRDELKSAVEEMETFYRFYGSEANVHLTPEEVEIFDEQKRMFSLYDTFYSG